MKMIHHLVCYSFLTALWMIAGVSCVSDSPLPDSRTEGMIQPKTISEWAQQDQECIRIGEKMLQAFNHKDYKSFVQYMLPEYHENITEADFNELWGSLGKFQD